MLACKFEHSFNQCNQPEHQTNKTIRIERGGGETYVKRLGWRVKEGQSYSLGIQPTAYSN